MGLKNLASSNLQDLNKIYLLKGDLEREKSIFLGELAAYYEDRSLEHIHSCYEPDELDGIIFANEKIGIFSDTIIPKSVQTELTTLVSYNFNSILKEVTSKEKETLEEYQTKRSMAYERAYELFKKAILVHDEWEKIYIEHMDFDKANQLTQAIIEELFYLIPHNNGGLVKERFFGGATYNGAVDFVVELTKHLKKRYYIKGRPGSGKSTMLKKILEQAKNLGLNVEVYHCGLDPNSLDMILIEELGFCIFDSTAPHEYFPTSKRDITIDMYEKLIEPNTDETFKSELSDIKKCYKDLMAQGTSFLKEGKNYFDKKSSVYQSLLDQDKKISFEEDLIYALRDDIS